MSKKCYLFMLAAVFTGVGLEAQPSAEKKKVLVVYFSHSGNTKEVANQIKEATGADVFEIVPEKAYPTNYQAVVDQAKKEIAEGHKPAIKGKIENIEQYDTIFVGSPCWWATIAPPVATFLSGYDLSGKTIIPFMTHEGSRMGHTGDDIKKLCPKSKVLDGFPVRGSQVKKAKEDILKWLREIKVIR